MFLFGIGREKFLILLPLVFPHLDPPISVVKCMRDYPEFCIFQAQFIAQSIGQAFQVAYVEFLKANGIEDHSFVKEMDYQEVLNSQEIFGNELALFAKKELQKEVINLSIPGISQTTIFSFAISSCL